jgi:hypothetical protein
MAVQRAAVHIEAKNNDCFTVQHWQQKLKQQLTNAQQGHHVPAHVRKGSARVLLWPGGIQVKSSGKGPKSVGELS